MNTRRQRTEVLSQTLQGFIEAARESLHLLERQEVLCQALLGLMEVAKESWDALHLYHPKPYPRDLGKNVCDWLPCSMMREAIHMAETALGPGKEA